MKTKTKSPKTEYITTEIKSPKSKTKLKLNEKKYSENNSFEIKKIVSTNINNLVPIGFESLVLSAQKAIVIDRYINIFFAIFTISIAFLHLFNFPYLYSFYLLSLTFIFKVLFETFYRINLDTNNIGKPNSIYQEKIDPILKSIKSSKKLWRQLTTSEVIDRKYSSGASEFVKLVPCNISKNAPFPFKTKSKITVFKSAKEIIIFLPEKLVIIKGKKIGIVDYLDIFIDVKKIEFIEKKKVPKDSKIIGTTWKYRNKNGTKDRRFKDNIEYPICLYGKLELNSDFGLDLSIIFSNGSMLP
jgi:hypothetical protein